MRNRFRSLAALAVVGLLAAGCSNAAAEGTAASSTAKYDEAVKFAECMRANGVAEFPDPPASGELTIDGLLNGSSLDADSPAWKRAVEECENLQPPGFTGNKRSAEQQAASLEFAQCIREHGVRDFPDPDPDGPIVDTNRIPSAEKNMPALDAAMRTCGATFGDKLGVTKP